MLIITLPASAPTHFNLPVQVPTTVTGIPAHDEDTVAPVSDFTNFAQWSGEDFFPPLDMETLSKFGDLFDLFDEGGNGMVEHRQNIPTNMVGVLCLGIHNVLLIKIDILDPGPGTVSGDP